jgi:hypothetical protein
LGLGIGIALWGFGLEEEEISCHVVCCLVKHLESVVTVWIYWVGAGIEIAFWSSDWKEKKSPRPAGHRPIDWFIDCS